MNRVLRATTLMLGMLTVALGLTFIAPGNVRAAPPIKNTMQLNLSHVCVNNQTEVHFVLLNVPSGVTPGLLTYSFFDGRGARTTRTVGVDKNSGNVWHYRDYPPNAMPYDIVSATVVVSGQTINLHNPSAYNTQTCGTVTAPTTAPTKVPTNTPAPTQAPTNTPAPTQAPTNTPAPTQAPTNTPAPTQAPTNTPAPTQAVPSATSTSSPIAEQGAIGDTVFYDSGFDGVQDAYDSGIGGVNIWLYRDNGDGQLSPQTDTLVAKTVTDNNGKYLFSGLPSGNYWVLADQYDQYTPTYMLYTCSTPNPRLIQLAPNQIYTDADFGFATSGV